MNPRPPRNLRVTAETAGPLTKHVLVDSSAVVTDVGERDLRGPSGVVVAFVSQDMNANLAVLDAGDDIPAHRNLEVDVLIVTVSGHATLVVDGTVHTLAADVVAVVPRGCERSISAKSRLVFYTVHVRRPGGATAG